MNPLVSAQELRGLLATDPRLIVLDVRFRLDKPNGVDDYEAGHIAGAIYVDLETELSTHGEPSDGRHPLASQEKLQRTLRRVGVHPESNLVVYDGGLTLASARAWWMLRGAGLSVRVLDGGLPAWTMAGLPLETGSVEPVASDITLTESAAGITIDEAGEWPREGVLVDVRAAVRFRGEQEPLDPIAGHIPGAVNLPAAGFFTEAGTFREATALADAFDSVGATADASVATYCGSGITAAQAALAAAIAGRDIDVFIGSWSAWSNTPDRPVATGE